ncbi:MAG TPA: FKBP-type peptidyl-prolyl cis-trans isomerase [Chitinophagaceae bacterium]|nr:FKBP-type peptidyl-prolyl cis-trans isomerase [Chitinophagaceae bacterium]
MRPLQHFLFLFFLVLCFCLSPASAQKKVTYRRKLPDKDALKNARDSLSYALAVNFSEWMKSQGLTDIDQKQFDLAMKQVLSGDSARLDDNTVKMIISEQLQALMKKRSEEAIAEGRKFLEENKSKPGVVTLPDGLEYLILEEGDGPKPSGQDKVTVHYEGRLINGKIFDSSIRRGQPITFSLNGVIRGWTEALQLMPTGSKWRLFIPPDLGYGGQANGQIPANSVLIFDVQLLSIQK